MAAVLLFTSVFFVSPPSRRILTILTELLLARIRKTKIIMFSDLECD